MLSETIKESIKSNIGESVREPVKRIPQNDIRLGNFRNNTGNSSRLKVLNDVEFVVEDNLSWTYPIFIRSYLSSNKK